jgi:hypothetical protein
MISCHDFLCPTVDVTSATYGVRTLMLLFANAAPLSQQAYCRRLLRTRISPALPEAGQPSGSPGSGNPLQPLRDQPLIALQVIRINSGPAQPGRSWIA